MERGSGRDRLGPRSRGRTDKRIQGLVAGVPLDRGQPLWPSGWSSWPAPPVLPVSDSSSRGAGRLRRPSRNSSTPFGQPVRAAWSSTCASTNEQLAEVTRLAEQCPEVTFVLDHLGKPDIRSGAITDWTDDLWSSGHAPQRLLQALRADVRGGRPAPTPRRFVDICGPASKPSALNGACSAATGQTPACRCSYPGWVATRPRGLRRT